MKEKNAKTSKKVEEFVIFTIISVVVPNTKEARDFLEENKFTDILHSKDGIGSATANGPTERVVIFRHSSKLTAYSPYELVWEVDGLHRVIESGNIRFVNSSDIDGTKVFSVSGSGISMWDITVKLVQAETEVSKGDAPCAPLPEILQIPDKPVKVTTSAKPAVVTEENGSENMGWEETVQKFKGLNFAQPVKSQPKETVPPVPTVPKQENVPKKNFGRPRLEEPVKAWAESNRLISAFINKHCGGSHSLVVLSDVLYKMTQESMMTNSEVATMSGLNLVNIGNVIHLHNLHEDIRSLLDPPTPMSERVGIPEGVALARIKPEFQSQVWSEAKNDANIDGGKVINHIYERGKSFFIQSKVHCHSREWKHTRDSKKTALVLSRIWSVGEALKTLNPDEIKEYLEVMPLIHRSALLENLEEVAKDLQTTVGRFLVALDDRGEVKR